ncbi:MAG: Crp/Fnr family transcriptional regulator [Flavobacterium sp.]|nr:Crp/Fnr family transcriptional regulator [Flavobacterium sp.]
MLLDCLKDIKHDSAFELLTDSDKAILNKNKKTLFYKKNDIILKQGTVANSIVYSKTGFFKLGMEGNQKNVILILKGNNTFLGLSSLFCKENIYLYNVTATEDCEVEIYDNIAFKEVLARNVAFSNEIIKFLNHNSSRIFKRFMNMMEKNSRGKVAFMLVCMANSVYFSNEYTMSLSRQDMADFLGLSMENVIRIIKELENDGLIEVNGKSIKLVNLNSLHKVCEFG